MLKGYRYEFPCRARVRNVRTKDHIRPHANFRIPYHRWDTLHPLLLLPDSYLVTAKSARSHCTYTWALDSLKGRALRRDSRGSMFAHRAEIGRLDPSRGAEELGNRR